MASGLVAMVVDRNTLVVNRGSTDGIVPGDSFAIFSPRFTVVDPATREVLGEFSRQVALARVEHVKERIAICSYTYVPTVFDQPEVGYAAEHRPAGKQDVPA